MVKYVLAGVLIFLKFKNNVQLLSYIVENAKGTAGVLHCSKSRKKVQLVIYFIENTERRFGTVFISLKIPKLGSIRNFLTEKAKIRYTFVPNCTRGAK